MTGLRRVQATSSTFTIPLQKNVKSTVCPALEQRVGVDVVVFLLVRQRLLVCVCLREPFVPVCVCLKIIVGIQLTCAQKKAAMREPLPEHTRHIANIPLVERMTQACIIWVPRFTIFVAVPIRSLFGHLVLVYAHIGAGEAAPVCIKPGLYVGQILHCDLRHTTQSCFAVGSAPLALHAHRCSAWAP